MHIAGGVLVGLVAALHAWFLVLEMFLWQKPRGLATFGMTAQDAATTATLAGNQGLYNGFLSAGLVWGLLASDPVGFRVTTFFLGCVILAGLYGGATVTRRILLVQAGPAAVALALVVAAH